MAKKAEKVSTTNHKYRMSAVLPK